MSRKNIDKLTIKDSFIFGAVMRNPEKCKALLECILDIRIRDIRYPELEKTIDKTIESKSIRLDVYVEDEFDTIYNIEMQATDKKNLPKRSRYYQGMIDLNIIDKGENYNKLKKSYVIFICDYDEFGLGRHIYTFEKTCNEAPSLKLGDDTVVVILNTKGTLDDVSKEVKELLDYIGGAEPQSPLTRSLDEEVENVKSSEDWRREFMTIKMMMNESKTLGEFKRLVSCIRGIDSNDIKNVSKVLKVEESFVIEVLELIAENPQLDDEEIAEMVVDY